MPFHARLALAMILAAASLAAAQSGVGNPPSLLVDPQWLLENLAGLTVVDVRDRGPFEKGHVKGAVNVKWKTFSDPAAPYPGNLNPDRAKIAAHLGQLGIGSDAPVVISSDPLNNWGEEGRMFWMLELLGHRKVAILDGGMPRWIAEQRPVETGAAAPRPAAFTVAEEPGRVIGWQEIHRRLGDPTLVIVDTRTRSEYDGATPYGEARGGRIPGAVHLPWVSLLKADGTFRPKAELESLFKSHGIGPTKEAALYCTGGVRSGFVYFAMRVLGWPKERNYDGSFWEWSSKPQLPVER